MIIIKATTKRGQRLLESANNCSWTSLDDIYGSYSYAKEKAYDWCWEQFCADPHGKDFGVGCANCFSFSASWNTIYDGKPAVRLETRSYSYIIV